MLRILKRIVIRSLNLPLGGAREALERSDYDQLMENLISFFEQRGNSGFLLRNQRFSCKTNKDDKQKTKRKFLLGLDNAENLLTKEVRDDFRGFIE